MSRRSHRGLCSVCGENGVLSWEHIPPRSAYNDRSVQLLRGTEALKLRPGEWPKGTIQQRGAGGYHSCPRCNNTTGGWYVPEFGRWVERAAGVLHEIGDVSGQDNCIYSRFADVAFMGVRPLLFLKQVVYMFLCINGSGFTAQHPELRGFVLNRERTGLPESCHFHLALTWGPTVRQVANVAAGDASAGSVTLMSDISFPPFSYVMWMGQPYHGLPPCDLTAYAQNGPAEILDVFLPLQVGFTHLVLPSDYRSRAALDRQLEESRRLSETPKQVSADQP